MHFPLIAKVAYKFQAYFKIQKNACLFEDKNQININNVNDQKF